MGRFHIAKGELWWTEGSPSAQQIESPFAREVIERDRQSRRTSQWKTAPRESEGLIPQNRLWAGSQGAEAMGPARMLFARPGVRPGECYYLLEVGRSTGLFRQDLGERHEVRLFHRNDLRCLGFDFCAATERLVLARANPDGTAHLEIYDRDGNCKGAVSGGDCIDSAPSFVPGQPTQVVYQSIGVARHTSGQVVGASHATLQRLNFASGEHQVLADDARFDYLAPRQAVDGTLYAIRRPAEKPASQRLESGLKDTLLFPWRLLKAVFGYLNFFSMVYGREPLKSAGGPRVPELDQDLGKLWLHGRMIDLNRLDPQARAAGLVPRQWELVRRRPGGDWEVLATHVAAFDLSPEGRVLLSNGFELSEWHDGQRRAMERADLVEQVGWSA